MAWPWVVGGGGDKWAELCATELETGFPALGVHPEQEDDLCAFNKMVCITVTAAENVACQATPCREFNKSMGVGMQLAVVRQV
jgi:hypothetical protein